MCTGRPASRAPCSAPSGRGSPMPALIEMLDGVHEVRAHHVALQAREPHLQVRTPPSITVGDVRIGGDEVIVMAGPCSAESEEQVRATAAAVRRAGAKILRGGAFKPRSSPYSFQGLGEEGLQLLRDAADGREPGARHRGDGRQPDRADRQVRRHLPGRRAQHAELHAAARARPRAQAGAAEARHLGDDRGVAAVGRVRPERRQHRRDPVRARHPDVRDRDAQHVRPLGDSGRARS